MTRGGGVAAIVLAGGRSERFGADDKLRVTLGGSTLLERAVAGVAHVADDIVVVLAPGAPADVPSPARAAHDPSEGGGPLVGVLAGLREVAGSDVAVVVGGDMPDLRPEVLLLMLDAIAERDVDVVTLDDGEGSRPLPSVLRTRAAADAADALLRRGRRRLRDLVGDMRSYVLDEHTWTAIDPERRTLRDVDEPGDLNR